jgi:hypothetical protein
MKKNFFSCQKDVFHNQEVYIQEAQHHWEILEQDLKMIFLLLQEHLQLRLCLFFCQIHRLREPLRL